MLSPLRLVSAILRFTASAMGAGMEAIQGFSKQHGLPIAMTVWLILWLDA